MANLILDPARNIVGGKGPLALTFAGSDPTGRRVHIWEAYWYDGAYYIDLHQTDPTTMGLENDDGTPRFRGLTAWSVNGSGYDELATHPGITVQSATAIPEDTPIYVTGAYTPHPPYRAQRP